MALLPESLLSCSSRTLLSGGKVRHLTCSALRWPAGGAEAAEQSRRQARRLRIEARLDSGPEVEVIKPQNAPSRAISSSSGVGERKQASFAARLLPSAQIAPAAPTRCPQIAQQKLTRAQLFISAAFPEPPSQDSHTAAVPASRQAPIVVSRTLLGRGSDAATI